MPTAPTAERPRRDGRGVESHTTAQRRGRADAVIAGLLFMGGLRRSEVSALEWRDVADASDSDGVLITVCTSKTNQEGDAADVRYLKNGAAQAIRTLRAAGIEAHLTAHSGRVGLASELTARGASTTEVMLAGNWKTARMVAHYSAGATAEPRGRAKVSVGRGLGTPRPTRRGVGTAAPTKATPRSKRSPRTSTLARCGMRTGNDPARLRQRPRRARGQDGPPSTGG